MKISSDTLAYDTLRAVDLFSGLSETELRSLLSVAHRLQPNPAERLFDYGSPEDSILVILTGTVVIYQNQKIIARLGAGEYFGEVALLEESSRSASARAESGTVLLEIPSDACRDLLRTNESFRNGATRMLCNRLRRSTAQVVRNSDVVNMMVHDMSNVLCMLDYAGIVAEALPEGDPNRQRLGYVMKAKTRLNTMMSGVLNSALGLSSEIMKTSNDLEALVRDCLNVELSQHPHVQPVRLEFKPQPPVESFAFYAPEMRRVVANLIINAAEASKPGATVTVELWQVPGTTTLTVVDRGCGIAPADQERVFDKHFSKKRGGYGLGLASCKEVVETLHGGSLTFVSTIGEGTMFRCELPSD